MKIMPTRRASVAALTMTVLTVSAFSVAPRPVLAAAPVVGAAEEGIERAESSKLISLKLPGTALRSTNPQINAQFEDALKKVAESTKGRLTKTETLIWTGQDEAKKKMPEALKGAGYTYTALQSQTLEGKGQISTFVAAKQGANSAIVGVWLENDQATLLAWGIIIPGAGSAGSSGSDSSNSSGDSGDAKKLFDDPAPVPGGKTPASLTGAWKFVNQGGQGKSGFAVAITLTPNGNYRYMLLRQPANSTVVSQSEHEGTVTFEGDGGDSGSFTIHPVKGHIKLTEGGKAKSDRPYEKHEMNEMTFHYEWRTNDSTGKRQLFIGTSPESLSPFQKAK
jgi:hypothetical protein